MVLLSISVVWNQAEELKSCQSTIFLVGINFWTNFCWGLRWTIFSSQSQPVNTAIRQIGKAHISRIPNLVNWEQSTLSSTVVQSLTNQIKSNGWSRICPNISTLGTVSGWSAHPEKQERHSVINLHKFSTEKSPDSSARSSTHVILSIKQ